MAETGYIHVKWVRDEPGARAAVAEAVAHDTHTAWRLLDNNVKGWDLTKLRLVVLRADIEGPNYFIRINPDLAPKAPPEMRHGNTDHDVEKQRVRPAYGTVAGAVAAPAYKGSGPENTPIAGGA